MIAVVNLMALYVSPISTYQGNNLLMGKQTLKKNERPDSQYTEFQNNVQQGNIQVYRGLIDYYDGNKKNAIKHLKDAEEKWIEIGENIASGMRRITVFSRYFNPKEIGFIETFKAMLSK